MKSHKCLLTMMILIPSVCLLISCGSNDKNKDSTTNEASETMSSVAVTSKDAIPSSSSESVSIRNSTSSTSSQGTSSSGSNASSDNSEISSLASTSDEEDSSQFDTAEQPDTSIFAEEPESEPLEMNSLQTLFASITSSTTWDDIDAYIEENGFEVHEFTGKSGYYIGYEKSAIRTRGRDREGEAVDVSFATSGDNYGTVKSAEYAIHTGFSTQYPLEFKDGVFYYKVPGAEKIECEDGYDAMQRYLKDNYQNTSK